MFIAHRGNGKHKHPPNTKEAIIGVLHENVSGVKIQWDINPQAMI